ncbi:MAG: hypothetical protein AAF582_05425 [Pseudomonadota bacterium]
MQDASAELYIDPEETLLWRSRPQDRLRVIKEPGENKWRHLAGCLYFLSIAIVMLLFAAHGAGTESKPLLIVSYVFAAIAFVSALIALVVPVVIFLNRPPKQIAHTDYLLTSHRFVIVQENGTSISIYPEAILSIESDRLPVGYHVVLHLLLGNGPFEAPIALTRFRLRQAEELEQRLIAWKNTSREIESYEQTH